MSSPDRSARRMALLALALVPALALGGCFRPMYASTAMGGTDLAQKLRTVAIDPVDGRVAQVVRNNLDFGLTGGAGQTAVAYRLHLIVVSSQRTTIVDPFTAQPEIDNVLLTGDFTLTSVATGQVVLQGRNYARKSFDRTLQRFAAVRAARDAENGAAEVIAEAIKTRVAAYFATHP